MGAIAPPVTVPPERPWPPVMAPLTATVCNGAVGHVPGKSTPPRVGATLAGVKRPLGTRAPRVRQAPDGCQAGGSNPRIAAGATVGWDWFRLCPCPQGNPPPEDLHHVTAHA